MSFPLKNLCCATPGRPLFSSVLHAKHDQLPFLILRASVPKGEDCDPDPRGVQKHLSNVTYARVWRRDELAMHRVRNLSSHSLDLSSHSLDISNLQPPTPSRSPFPSLSHPLFSFPITTNPHTQIVQVFFFLRYERPLSDPQPESSLATRRAPLSPKRSPYDHTHSFLSHMTSR